MLPVRGATQLHAGWHTSRGISIHAPRAGSDCFQGQDCPLHKDFNPCSPCGERRASLVNLLTDFRFQSMLPVRGATNGVASQMAAMVFQSMLPVRGATVRLFPHDYGVADFNPCSPCGERPATAGQSDIDKLFQSMLPVRGATKTRTSFPSSKRISIHAPRAGSDTPSTRSSATPSSFQSMLPVRGATRASGRCCSRPGYFNPCSPCGERLCLVLHFGVIILYFNPCSPCGERPGLLKGHNSITIISIHAPRAGSDGKIRQNTGCILAK